jgi:hypothetical protein
VETSEAKVGENRGLDYYLFIPVIPSGSIIPRHRLWCVRHRWGAGFMRVLPRRAGAEMGIPTMTSKNPRARRGSRLRSSRLRAMARLEARRARG